MAVSQSSGRYEKGVHEEGIFREKQRNGCLNYPKFKNAQAMQNPAYGAFYLKHGATWCEEHVMYWENTLSTCTLDSWPTSYVRINHGLWLWNKSQAKLFSNETKHLRRLCVHHEQNRNSLWQPPTCWRLYQLYITQLIVMRRNLEGELAITLSKRPNGWCIALIWTTEFVCETFWPLPQLIWTH